MPFDQAKIVHAIVKAAQAVQGHDEQLAHSLAEAVVRAVATEARDTIPTVESIQDMIEKVLIAQGHARTAKAFILYRATRSRIREGKSELMETVGDLLEADAPGAGVAVPKLVAIGQTASREFHLNRVLDEAHAEAHLTGDWHLHGLAHYGQAPHAAVLPYRDRLTHGFQAGHGRFDRPRSAHDAAIATLALLQAAQADCHGSLALAAFDADWAAVLPNETDEAALTAALGTLVTLLHALPAQPTGQPISVSVHVGLDTTELGRRVTRALLSALAAMADRVEPALRPHLVFRVAEGVNRSAQDPNHDLLTAAVALATRWPGVTFLHDAPEAVLLGHEARLTGTPAGLAARLTLNLPRLALKARRDGMPFALLLDETLEAAAAQLRHRLDALTRRPAGEFPVPMARAQVGLSVVGLAEALVVLGGAHHGASEAARAEGLALIGTVKARCATLSEQHIMTLHLHAAEADEVAVRFARLDRRQFGMIRGVTERPAYTGGVGVPSEAHVSLGDRLAIEGEYAALLEGGMVFPWSLAEAPAPAALHEALEGAIAAGHRAFAADFPTTLGGRPVGRRRGFLGLES